MSDEEQPGEQSGRPRRDDRGDSADRRPRRDEGRPRRDDARPPRSADRGGDRSGAGGRPQRHTDRPQRDGDRARGAEFRPRRDDGRPSREGERPRGSEFRPRRDDGRPQGGGERPRGGDARPRRDDVRPQRDGELRPRRDEGRPARGGESRPRRDDARPQRDGQFRPRRDDARPQRDGDRPRRDDAPGRRSTERSGRTPSSDRPFRDAPRRPGASDPVGAHRSGGGRHLDEPEIPEDIKPADLDKAARGELRTLSKENAEMVAKHLVAASRTIEDDPAEALRHALAAARRAGRVAVVRESVAIAAYATGDFALALRELRTFRRISGSDDQIALMVDSERGVGRPDRALEVGRAVDRTVLPVEAQVGLAIAMSGARLDLGDARAALDELERAPIDLQRVHEWSPSLYAAFAAVHEELGDDAEAERWAARSEKAERVLDDVDAEADSVDVVTEPDEAAAARLRAEVGVGADVDEPVDAEADVDESVEEPSADERDDDVDPLGDEEAEEPAQAEADDAADAAAEDADGVGAAATEDPSTAEER